MQRHEQRGVAALGDELGRRRRPEPQVIRERHVGERLRPPRVRVEPRREVPLGHPHVVLLGGQAYLLPGRGPVEALVSPGAGELTGQPGVRGLTDRHDPVSLWPDQHLLDGERCPPSRPARGPGRSRRTCTCPASGSAATVEVAPPSTVLPFSFTPPPLIATSCGTGESFVMSIVTGPAFAASADLSNFSWPEGSAASASLEPPPAGSVRRRGTARCRLRRVLRRGLRCGFPVLLLFLDRRRRCPSRLRRARGPPRGRPRAAPARWLLGKALAHQAQRGDTHRPHREQPAADVEGVQRGDDGGAAHARTVTQRHAGTGRPTGPLGILARWPSRSDRRPARRSRSLAGTRRLTSTFARGSSALPP